MNMPVYKRGDKWHFTKTINGVRYRCALPTARTKAQAEDAEREKLNEIHEDKFGKPKGTTPFVKYAEEVYLPWAKENKRSKNDQYFIKPIKEFFKRKTFAEISALLIEKYKSERKRGVTKTGAQRKPASVNRELACLSRIFSRDVPINEVVRNELLCLPKLGEFVFTSDRTGRAIVEIKRAFRACCRLAGIEDLHFHDLRHTAATRWAEAGMQIAIIAELLGHADLRMTSRYTHATDYAKRRAVEAAARVVVLGNSGHNLVTMKKREA